LLGECREGVITEGWLRWAKRSTLPGPKDEGAAELEGIAAEFVLGDGRRHGRVLRLNEIVARKRMEEVGGIEIGDL